MKLAQRGRTLPGQIAIAIVAFTLGGYLIAGVVAALSSSSGFSLRLWSYDLNDAWHEVVRTTALILGALVVAVGVVLNYRRQQATEASLEHAREDELNRRTTEDEREQHRRGRELAESAAQLYDSAINQLSNESPVVRTAAMYTLDRLGDQHPDYRQNVVDIWCGYLRTPNPLVRLHRELTDLQRLLEDDQVEFTGDSVSLGMQAVSRATGEFEEMQNEARRASKPWTPSDIAAESEAREATQRLLQRRLAAAPETTWTAAGGVSDVDLASAHLHNADFTAARFLGHANFDRATFTGITAATFDDATFDGWAQFSRATFYGMAHYRNASFDQAVLWQHVAFKDMATFNRAVFSAGASFAHSTFHHVVLFDRAQFKKGADFDKTRLERRASFLQAEFHGSAYFHNTAFTGFAQFDSARFRRKPNFDGVGFMDTPSFENTRFDEGAPHRLNDYLKEL